MLDKNNLILFLQFIQKRFEEFCSEYNSYGSIEKKSWDTTLGPIEVSISNGTVFEKASLIYCDVSIDTPPVLAEKIGATGSKAQALVLEVNLFPVNPHTPKGYLELRANITDKLVLAGGTDIFPYFQNKDDVSFFADGIRELCKRHGKNYDELRTARADFFKSKYRKENVGSHAGIYSFHIEEKDFAFYKDMANTFFKLYGDLVEKRKIEAFTEHDRNHQLLLHGIWTQWILLEDAGTKYGLEKGIPPEALLGAILPPKAKF